MQIDHVAIWCKELDLLQEFYETHFALRSSAKYVNVDKEFESYSHL